MKRFNSVVLKRAKSQRCFGVVLCEWICYAENMTQFLLIYIYKYIFKYINDFSSLHCDLKMLVSESTRVCWFSLVCATYCACCLPCFRLSSWEFGLLPYIKVRCPCLCVWLKEWDSETPGDCVAADWVLSCSWPVCSAVAVPLCSDC